MQETKNVLEEMLRRCDVIDDSIYWLDYFLDYVGADVDRDKIISLVHEIGDPYREVMQKLKEEIKKGL